MPLRGGLAASSSQASCFICICLLMRLVELNMMSVLRGIWTLVCNEAEETIKHLCNQCGFLGGWEQNLLPAGSKYGDFLDPCNCLSYGESRRAIEPNTVELDQKV